MRRLRILLSGLIPATAALLITLPGGRPAPAAQPPKAENPPREKLSQAVREKAASGLGAAVNKGKEKYRVLNVEYKTPAQREAACKGFGDAVHIFATYDRFVTVFIPADRASLEKGFDAVEKADGFVWFDIAETINPPPPPDRLAPAAARGTAEKIVRGGFGGRTGKGVVIAIIDSGVDFRHPDFIREVGGKRESRFVAIWDTTRPFEQGNGQPGPVEYFKDVPVGTLFLREHLNDDLNGKTSLGNFDKDGHGTGCAGIAAGNGTAIKLAEAKAAAPAALKGQDYTGVAPDADLIAIRVSKEEDEGFWNAWLLNAACDWLDRLDGAKDRPVVISCSFGGHDGGHDGSIIEERWLTTWLENRKADLPARLVFIAAGNEATSGMHAAAPFDKNQLGKITWNLARGTGEATQRPAFIELFVDDVNAKENETTSPKAFDVDVDPAVGKITGGGVHPITGSAVVYLKVEASGSLELSTTSGKSFRADAYIYPPRDPKTGKPLGKFVQGAGNLRQIGTPACTVGAFAVGSYDFEPNFLSEGGLRESPEMVVGGISPYSNAGYLRKGGVKPDFVAPGQWHSAAVPNPVPSQVKAPPSEVDLSGHYQRFNGTSAATPYAAGIAALVLEKNPNLTSKQFRGLIEKHASRDKFTGAPPNERWGYGKLDLEAVKRLLP